MTESSSSPGCTGRRAAYLPGVGAHELSFGKDVAFHGRKELFPGRARLQVELPVQRGELEEVAVGFAGRRRRGPVADLAEVVGALCRAVGERRLLGDTLAQFAGLRRQVEHDPV